MNATSNPKEIQIMDTGKELFWKFGFKRVTIEEICREAGVSKMTFYKFFPNKLKLVTAIMDDVFADTLNKVKKLTEEHESADKTLKKILQLKAEGSHGISEEFIKDLYTHPDGDLKIYMEVKTREMLAEITQVYESGKKDGWVRKDLNIPFLILFSQKIINMFKDDEIHLYFDSSQGMIMEITNLLVYGISPHK